MGLKKFLKKIAKPALTAVGGAIGGPAGAKLGNAIGGAISYSGSKKASKAEQQGYTNGIAALQANQAQARADFSPYMQAGAVGVGNLMDPSRFTSSPGYKYALDQSSRAIQDSAAGAGGLYSGATGKALQENAIGLANQDFNNWWNQQSNLAGLGATATGQVAGIGTGTAGGINANLIGAAGAKSTGISDRTNILTNTLGTISGMFADQRDQNYDPELQPVKVTAKKIGKKLFNRLVG